MKSGVLATAVAAVLMVSSAAASAATTLTETFDNPFNNWETAWFGANSNAQVCYGQGGGRGNDPYGLWISDGASNCGGTPVTITFGATFAASLTSFGLDVGSFGGTTLTIFDKVGASLLSVAVPSNAFNYNYYSVSSGNGIGGFSFSGAANGNTSIDNLNAVVSATPGVPEPASWALMIGGFGLVGSALRRRRVAANA